MRFLNLVWVVWDSTRSFLRWPKRLDGRLRISINTTIYHASIAKYVLALNRGKPEVPFKTLRSFGKYLEMWKFH